MAKYLYITSDIPSLITVNGIFLGETKEPILFTTEPRARLYIQVSPLRQDYLPFAVSAIIEDNLIISPDMATVTLLPAKRYLIKFICPYYRPVYPLQLIDRTEITKTLHQELELDPLPQKPPKSKKIKYTVALKKDSYTRLEIFRENMAVFEYVLPDGLSGFNLKAEIIGPSIIAAVTAGIDGGFKQYLLVVKENNGAFEVKIDNLADRIEQEDGKITILNAVGDIAGRGIITIYDAASFEQKDKYYVYVTGSPIEAERKDMAKAVFEAVKAEDFAEAAKYLTASLNRILPSDKLVSFFADYDYAIDNIFYKQYNNSVLLVDRNNNATLFMPEFSNGKIDNIREIELPPD